MRIKWCESRILSDGSNLRSLGTVLGEHSKNIICFFHKDASLPVHVMFHGNGLILKHVEYMIMIIDNRGSTDGLVSFANSSKQYTRLKF